MPKDSSPLSLEQANAEITRLRAELAAKDKGNAAREPIAIVGMGCRYPGGVRTPDEFWELLQSGRDILREIPAERWDVDAYYDPEVTVPGKMYVRHGHYLDAIDQFDPQFFGLSPREAESLDPQQRLVMEVSWETLEHAGIAPDSLSGGKTSVFVGQYWDDYSMQRIYGADKREIDRYAQLSGLRGLTAGRICHILDSHGPAIQLDTACSSSSLAVHLACQSLRNGESDLALAGGVSLILAPEHLIGICQMTALSPDGRCKTFDASADGFGQGEGCGMIALKRLSDAQADNDTILAVVQGSAVNHDGHARTVTTPSGPAQRMMLQDALDDAGLAPHQVDYLETHGTGTPLGDPIEVMAIARVLCEERTKPLYLGSVKTNVGHLDSAAGIVGLMKMVLALQHDTIPRHLNYSKPNPHIPWDKWPLEVPLENIPWRGEERFAGISAFGMSGTNVHLIVGQVAGTPSPQPLSLTRRGAKDVGTSPPRPIRERGSGGEGEELLTLSAQSPASLTELAQRYAELLQTENNIDLQQLCFSAATGRSHFTHRATFTANNPQTLAQSLTDFAAGNTPIDTCTGSIGRRAPKLAFLFTGQGAQHVGMGKELYDTHVTFRYWIDRCAELLAPQLEQPLTEFMWAGEALHQTQYTQPALFAIEYSLAKLLEEWGVLPDMLLGHSIGEYAAACIAGVFTLEEGMRLVAARGRLMQSLPVGGQMVSVASDEATVRAALGDENKVAIAAVNAPQSIVISGEGAAIEAAVEQLSSQGIKTTALKVSHAFHSPLMEPILDEFRAIAATVSFNPPDKTLLSNVTGQPWTEAQLSADYWVDHLRGAVRFADGIAYAQQKKIQTFVEIGPRATLSGLGRACVGADYGVWLPALKPKREWATLLNTVAELYVRGVGIDWPRFYKSQIPAGLKKIQLPNYPWRYQRCWTDVVSTGGSGQRLHPLVHRRIDNASSSIIFESALSTSSPAYLDDHRVFGSVVFPASAFFEMAMVVARTIFKQDEVALTNVSIGRALVLSETPATVQMVATPNVDRYDFEISSRSATDAKWISHTKGTLERRLPSPAASIDIAATLTGFTEPVDLAELSARFEARGLEYFPRFRAIEEIHKRSGEHGSAFARVELPAEAILPGDSYRLHPVITDASFRIAEAMFPEEDAEHIHLPFGISGFSCEQAASGSVWVKATGQQHEQTRVVNLELFNEAGERIATVEDLTLRSVPVFSLQRAMAQPRAAKDVLNQWLYQFVWEEDVSDIADITGHAEWLLLADKGSVATALVARLKAQSQQTHIANNADDVAALIAADKAQALTGVVHLWCMDASEAEPDAALLESLNVVQALARADIKAPHWLVTQGAQAVLDDDIVSPWQTRFWGFGRTLQVEHPGQLGACIDLSNGVEDIELLVAALSRIDGETELAFRAGTRRVARLVRPETSIKSQIPSVSPKQRLKSKTFESKGSALQQKQVVDEGSPPLKKGEQGGFKTFEASPDSKRESKDKGDTAPAPLELDENASYLITGGVGALGLQVAQFLATAGAKHLLLTGRSGVSTDDQRSAIHALEDAGVKVEVVAADIGNADDVTRVLALAPKLRGIVHAAGVLDDGMLLLQTAERFRAVASPKVDGAWHLHTQTLKHELDFFVLFSSVASVIGSPGQSNYASANAFMDGLAHLRKQQGLPATAINWGPWADVGMAASEVVLRRLMHDGWQPMTASQGCDFIAHLLTVRELAQAAVIPLEWATFVQRIPGASEWSTLQQLIPAGGQSPLTASAAEAAAQRVKAATAAEQVDVISSYLLERIAQTLRVPAADLDEFAALSALGIDSLTAVELRSWVQGDLDVELAVDQMFTTPSIRELAVAIDQLLRGASDNAKVDSSVPDTNEGQWLVCPQPRPDAKLRLFCFPYAGGGAAAFNDWVDVLPAEIELCIVQLPGREERLREPLLTDMAELVATLGQELRAYDDRPFAFFGHSMGAIVAYETACRLRDLGASLPEHLFLSARAAPHLQDKSEPLRFLENEAFIERLHALYGAVPEAIRQSAELQEVFLPILRADVALLETHEPVASALLDCPVTVLGGAGDPAISKTMLAGWRKLTSEAFVQREFAGGHFYLHEERDGVVKLVVDFLASHN